jgi:hypothetical protein
VFGARRGFGPIGKARMSRDKGYAILLGKMTSPSRAKLETCRWAGNWQRRADARLEMTLIERVVNRAGMAELADAADSK